MNTISSLLKWIGETIGANPNTLITSSKTLIGAINETKAAVNTLPSILTGSYVYNGLETDTISFVDNNVKGKTHIITGTQDAGNPALRATINSSTGEIVVYIGGTVSVTRINYIVW